MQANSSSSISSLSSLTTLQGQTVNDRVTELDQRIDAVVEILLDLAPSEQIKQKIYQTLDWKQRK